MRIIMQALLRTLVLLVCSVIQVFAIVAYCIGAVFATISRALKSLSGRLLGKLDRGKYESAMRSIAE